MCLPSLGFGSADGPSPLRHRSLDYGVPSHSRSLGSGKAGLDRGPVVRPTPRRVSVLDPTVGFGVGVLSDLGD